MYHLKQYICILYDHIVTTRDLYKEKHLADFSGHQLRLLGNFR